MPEQMMQDGHLHMCHQHKEHTNVDMMLEHRFTPGWGVWRSPLILMMRLKLLAFVFLNICLRSCSLNG